MDKANKTSTKKKNFRKEQRSIILSHVSFHSENSLKNINILKFIFLQINFIQINFLNLWFPQISNFSSKTLFPPTTDFEIRLWINARGPTQNEFPNFCKYIRGHTFTRATEIARIFFLSHSSADCFSSKMLLLCDEAKRGTSIHHCAKQEQLSDE